MNKSVLSTTMAGLVLLTSACLQAAPDPFPPTGPGVKSKLAFSHDGNSYDPDDWGAVAFTQAVAWSFGKIKDVVHLQHSDNPNLNKEDPHHKNMKESVAGAVKRFEIDPGVVFDCYTQPAEAVAHFVKITETLSATNTLFFMCAGPMEYPWRCINATPVEKRPFITCVSHSTWNEEFKDKSHTWANMKSLPGGTKFIDIRDQNAGFGKNSNWGGLLGAGTNETMNWLESRATLPQGATNDVSDCGMTWYAMTGNENGRPDMFISKLKWAYSSLSMKHNIFNTDSRISIRNGKVEVILPEAKEHVKLIVTNVAGASTQFPIGNGSSKLFSLETSKLNNGLNYISLQSQDGVKQTVGKINILK